MTTKIAEWPEPEKLLHIGIQWDGITKQGSNINLWLGDGERILIELNNFEFRVLREPILVADGSDPHNR